MEVLYPRCCGLDVHQKTVVACVKTPEGKESRTFKTVTGELLELGRMACIQRRHSCRNGEYRRILAAGLQPFRAAKVYSTGSKRPSYQNSPRTQDGYERC